MHRLSSPIRSPLHSSRPKRRDLPPPNPFGGVGPEGALVPSAPPRSLTDDEQFHDGALIDALGFGFGGDRSELRSEADDEFSRLAGAPHGRLDELRFTEGVEMVWGLTRGAARACFFAGDRDRSGRINRDEYLLLREAFVHQSPHREHEELRRIRLSAIYFWYCRNLEDEEQIITPTELAEWLSDMCSGAEHVRGVGDVLFGEGWADGDGSTTEASTADGGNLAEKSRKNALTQEWFVNALMSGTLRAKMGKLNLDPEHMLSKFFQHDGQAERVVFDGRAETARCSDVNKRDNFMITAGVSTDVVPGFAVNEGLVLQPSLRAVGGWRGSLAVQRGTDVFDIAERVINVMVELAYRTRAAPHDMSDDDWLPGGACLDLLLGAGEAQQRAAILALCDGCRHELSNQPTLVRAKAPVKIFGDVHGQLRDLLLLFAFYGAPTHKGGDVQTTTYIFNGDWVDRGAHQLEVVLVLFALKAMYPSRVFLLRGNHEFRGQNEAMGAEGFLHHTRARLPSAYVDVYAAVHAAFDWLPIGCLVGEAVLVLHGGVGDASWGLAELEHAVPRPLTEPFATKHTLHALWSDPSDSDDAMRAGVHLSQRGPSIPEFGPDVTDAFCRANGLSMVVRSHQFVRQGYKVMHAGRLVTLFSARNYFSADGQANDAAMLLIARDGNGHLRLHPKRLEHLPLHSAWWEKAALLCVKCLSI